MKTVRISIITCCLISLVAVLLQCSGEPLGNQSSPIFGNERINVFYSSGIFHFNTPEEVKFLVLGIFSNPPVTDGERILNPGDLIAGSRTGLDEFGRTEVQLAKIWDVIPGVYDFDEGNPWTPVAGSWWAVWGYDEWGNLTHSSSAVLF